MSTDGRPEAQDRTRVLSVGRGAASLERPLNPPLPPRQGHDQVRDELARRVAELAAAGALDAGNGDVLDAWIETLEPQWRAHHAVDSTEREALARLNTGRAEAALAAAQQRADAARARLQDAVRLLEQIEPRVLVRTEASPEQPERRRRQRPGLDRLDGLVEKPSQVWFNRGLILVAAAGDFVTFYMTLADLLRHSPVFTAVLVLAFTVASVGLMHAIGRAARDLREGQGGLGRVFITVTTLVWLFLGGAACYVRAQVEPGEATSGEAVFGADPDAAAAAVDTPLLSAVLLAGLFLASGLLAFWVGFSQHRPRMQAYLSLREELAEKRAAVADADAAVIAADMEVANARAEEERVALRGEAAAGSREAEIRELKELVRVLVAGHLGSPSATNALTTSRSDDPTNGHDPSAPIGASRPGPGVPLHPLNGHGPVPAAH